MSISNQGTSPPFAGVTLQVDTITLSSVTPAALSKRGIVSYPAFSVSGASPTSDDIVVYDVTTAQPLVLGTDYTLTPSGAGSTLTYSVTRIASSVNSANGNTCRVTYNYGTIPDNTDDSGAMGYTGAAPTGTQFRTGVADTTGQSVAGMGAALPGGSLTDPAMGKQSSSETGAPGSEYRVVETQPSAYGWPGGSPETAGTYGPNLPSAYVPSSTAVGRAGVIDTTVGGGAVRTDASPAYRAPGGVVPGSVRDTSLTDLLGNMLSAMPITGTSYAAQVIDTSYAGSPAAPTALAAQTDTFANVQTATAYYASQAGVVPASLVVKVGVTTAVQGTDYTVAVTGAGAKTSLSITRVGASSVITVGSTVVITYSYGDATYWESNVPAAPPAAPTIGAVTAVNRGIQVAWTPPAGQTEIDFYQIECSDQGTMFVPYTGQPKFYGQVTPSGGGETGSPAYQSDSFLTSAFPATLSRQGVLTPPGQVVVRDATQGAVLRYGYDYTIAATGAGPTLTYVVSLVVGSSIVRTGDTITIGYFWFVGTTISAVYTQGVLPNTPVIYKPDATTPYSQGYRFRVAAGNRRGLGTFSAWSAYAVPLNFNAPQPGHQGQTQTELALDPQNAINPIYRPDGTVKAGTGLGG
jgi:hypothetical protein